MNGSLDRFQDDSLRHATPAAILAAATTSIALCGQLRWQSESNKSSGSETEEMPAADSSDGQVLNLTFKSGGRTCRSTQSIEGKAERSRWTCSTGAHHLTGNTVRHPKPAARAISAGSTLRSAWTTKPGQSLRANSFSQDPKA